MKTRKRYVVRKRFKKRKCQKQRGKGLFANFFKPLGSLFKPHKKTLLGI